MAFKSKITLILSLILLLWLGFGYGAGKSAEKPFYVRVAIIQDAASLKIAVHGPFEISTLNTDEVLYKAKNLRTSLVLPTPPGVKIRDMELKIFGVKIVPATSGNIYINGRRFRGEINIIRKEDLKLLVVNNLELEDYIKGILYHEVSHRWPLEVIKAQAVVARAFAVYQVQISKARDFDLTSDIYSQVYGGKTSETYRTSVAVNRTRGEILNYKGKIFPAFYHATCAGHTEDAAVLWNINLAPLKGVVCGFCVGSPHFNWSRDLSVYDAENKLSAAGLPVTGLEDIVVTERDASDRVSKLKLVSAENSSQISGKDFRQIFDPNVIRSANFKIEKSGDHFRIQGIGWGHGVGMCQWGAYFMSLGGKKYDQILQYYYPGSKIARLER